MANTFAPTGFQFIRNYNNGAPTYQSTSAAILYTNPNTIAKGDVVKQTSGYVDLSAYNDSEFFGVFDGCQYYDTALQKTVFANSWTAPSTALAGSVTARVITDPMAVFLVQCGASGVGPVTQAQVGLNATFVHQTPTNVGISAEYLNQATIANTSTFPFRIIGYGANLNNDNTSANNYVEVIANPGAWSATNGTGE